MKARDYNGDGYADLAIGAPGPWWEGKPSTVSGYVIVSYGGADGLTTRRQKLLQPEQAGQPGASTNGSSFGVSSASGDFDRDGYADLAVGATPESNLACCCDDFLRQQGGAVQPLGGSARARRRDVRGVVDRGRLQRGRLPGSGTGDGTVGRGGL
ncbi:FG-GAP repeat protein [Nonomuraea sp. NPDC051941]|uniref:FG-GAP repeat protein n=1 Tax=Nonomuraea sp. NPDC051941 TaxID=3364373 RepID=UPI0037C7EACD